MREKELSPYFAYHQISAAYRPFKVIFKTDANEITTGIGITMAMANEANGGDANPSIGGIVGFSLNYFQLGC